VGRVFWIDGDPQSGLAIVLRPRGDEWVREDLEEMKQSGVQTLISLLHPHEAVWLGLADEAAIALELGLGFVSYPILDAHVPDDEDHFRSFVSGLAERISAGEKIGLHCQGSIGRATVTAAGTLIHLGWKPKDALAAIQAARGCVVPDTAEQRRWILRYKAKP
jgi:protein-tyrosine phosphatase